MPLPPMYLRGAKGRDGQQGFSLQNIPVLDPRYPGWLMYATWPAPYREGSTADTQRLTVRIQPPPGNETIIPAGPVRSLLPTNERGQAVMEVVIATLTNVELRLLPPFAPTAIWFIEAAFDNAAAAVGAGPVLAEALSNAGFSATIVQALGANANVLGIIVENLGDIVEEQPSTR